MSKLIGFIGSSDCYWVSKKMFFHFKSTLSSLFLDQLKIRFLFLYFRGSHINDSNFRYSFNCLNLFERSKIQMYLVLFLSIQNYYFYEGYLCKFVCKTINLCYDPGAFFVNPYVFATISGKSVGFVC